MANRPRVLPRCQNAEVPDTGRTMTTHKQKAMAGAGVQALRHLDYWLHHPERSMMLVRGGILVAVPRVKRHETRPD